MVGMALVWMFAHPNWELVVRLAVGSPRVPILSPLDQLYTLQLSMTVLTSWFSLRSFE